ncbi:hypothetical protein NADFUDRAFT_47401 [Nadsonia fulvescens var. elongata DSM 6958]|uniref:Uncharacterized protein n=1 Tax=Nadsonia fulvescens var. elongata DSM 6958 TaxID=857566 RepID=A0A1E3PJ07_9ASCO|nr:hypothetical protein NADFUDRAFT_47401 [Nadsonia fulvescens var. elongata DSM 6958]
MKKADQDAVLAYLEDRMRGDWKEMTLDEKKAAWFVYYGAWGARAPDVEQVTGKGMGTFIKVGLAFTLGLTGYMVSKDLMASDEDKVTV